MWHLSIASWRVSRELRIEAAQARALAATFSRSDVSQDLCSFADALEDDATRLERALWAEIYETHRKAKLG